MGKLMEALYKNGREDEKRVFVEEMLKDGVSSKQIMKYAHLSETELTLLIKEIETDVKNDSFNAIPKLAMQEKLSYIEELESYLDSIK